MNDRSVTAAAMLGLCLAVGLTALGGLVGWSLYRARSADRYVTVKGFSEREVPANLAVWPIVFTATSNDLMTLQQRIDGDAQKVVEFLKADFPADQISASSPRVTDREAQGVRRGAEAAQDRYAAESTITIRTDKIDVLRKATERSGELVKRGVAMIRSYEATTQFFYTDLSKIKPEMIAEATHDARKAAEQFAHDSGSRVGPIRNAQQGSFSIEDRDPFSPEFKKIRVVTTIQYFLED